MIFLSTSVFLGHLIVGHFVNILFGFILVDELKPFNQDIEEFRIVFFDKTFNAGSVHNIDICRVYAQFFAKAFTYLLAYRFGNIDKIVEEGLDIINIILLEYIRKTQISQRFLSFTAV